MHFCMADNHYVHVFTRIIKRIHIHTSQSYADENCPKFTIIKLFCNFSNTYDNTTYNRNARHKCEICMQFWNQSQNKNKLHCLRILFNAHCAFLAWHIFNNSDITAGFEKLLHHLYLVPKRWKSVKNADKETKENILH